MIRTLLCVDLGKNSGLYDVLQAVNGLTLQVHIPLRRSDWQDLLTDNTSMLAGWPGHFRNLFNANRNVQDSATNRFPQHALKQELDEPPNLR